MTKVKVALTAMMMVPLLFGVNQVHAEEKKTSNSISTMETVELSVDMKVGGNAYLSGWGFYLNVDNGVISLDRNGYVVALKEGKTSVGATLHSGQHVVYYISVTR